MVGRFRDDWARCSTKVSCRAREDLGLVFDELDYQLACQAYLWALPLVSYAQWKTQHYDVFGATSSDLVHYVSYRDRLGLITANATTPYTLNFFDLAETGPARDRASAGPTAGGISDFWQRECAVLGEMGPDRGRGGRHVVVGPGQDVARGGRRLLRAARHRHEHHVRLPHPRPRPAARSGARRRGADLPLRRPRATRSRPGSSPRTAGPGPATSRAAWTTGCGCTTSTSARSSTSVTGSTSPCSSSSGSRRASRSSPTNG